MNIDSLALIVRTLGELLIGYSVLRVHNQVGQENKIDSHVKEKIKNEKQLTLVGIVLILVGLFIELFLKRI